MRQVTGVESWVGWLAVISKGVSLRRLWAVVWVLVLAACNGSSEPAETTTTVVGPGETSTTVTSPSVASSSTVAEEAGLTLEVECLGGESLEDAPFDRSWVPRIEDGADTSWAGVVITGTNSSSEALKVAPGFDITFYATDGSEIATTTVADSFAAAYWAAPGQSFTRSLYRFDLEGIGPLVVDESANDQMLSGDLGSCELAGDVPTEPSEGLVLPDGLTFEPGGTCGARDDEPVFEAEFVFTNSRDDEIEFNYAFEILDGDGNRIGIGGDDGEDLDPGETDADTGTASMFTMANPDTAVECRMLVVVEA